MYLVRSATESIAIHDADLTLTYGTDRTQGLVDLHGTADAFLASPLNPGGVPIPMAPGAEISVGNGTELTALGYDTIPVQADRNYLLLTISDSLNAPLIPGARGLNALTNAGVSTAIVVNPAAPGFGMRASATGLLRYAPITDVGFGLSGTRDFAFRPRVAAGLPSALATPFDGQLMITGTRLASSSTAPWAYTGTSVIDVDPDLDGRWALTDAREPFRVGVNGDMSIASTWLASILGVEAPIAEGTAVYTQDGDAFRVGITGVTDPARWMPAWAPLVVPSASASAVLSSVLAENQLTLSSALTLDLSRLPHPSGLGFRSVDVASSSLAVSSTGIRVQGAFGESPLSVIDYPSFDFPVRYDLFLTPDRNAWQMNAQGRVRIAGRTLTSATVDVDRNGARVSGTLDGVIAAVTLTGTITSDASFRFTGTATVNIPTRTASQVFSTVTSAAQCGTSVVTEAARCGTTAVTDATRCGTRSVTDATRCGTHTVTSGAQCGWNTVGSCILHPTRCRVARSCSVANTCSVANSCSVASTCNIANTCNVANTCTVPNTCMVGTWAAGTSDTGNYRATVNFTLGASGLAPDVSGSLSCLTGISACGLATAVRFDAATLRVCVQIVPVLGMSGTEICGRI